MKNGKQAYEVLELLPKSTIFAFYVKSIFIGLWVLAKWLVFLLWNSISQTKNNNNSPDSLDYDGYHDKPPTILVDNKIGRHSYVKLKGVKLHYVEAGNCGNPLIILLHGFPDCWLGWRNQIEELSKFFRVVALDMKGFNDSDKPIWRQLYSPKKICDELRQFIYSLGCSSATIIGHDIGAVVGWFFAHTNPGNVDRFICVSAPHPNLILDSLPPKSVINHTWLQFVQLPLIPELDHANRHSIFLEKCLKSAIKDTSKAVMSLRKSVDNNFDSEFNFNVLDTYKYVFSRRTDWSGPLNYYRNFFLYKIAEGNTIRCPVLVITGNGDDRCRMECMVKSTDYCENSIVKIIEGAGHWPHQQVSEEFNKIILNFLVGKRAILQPHIAIDKNSKGIMGRMLGAVTSSVKMGSSVLDSVHQRTNNLTSIHSEPVDPFF